MGEAMYDLLYIIELLSSVLFKIGIMTAIICYLRRKI
tara:strand:- start:1434 stop:1544 length:111 start_codon:yes stop_codon:yes gene_type:complete